MPQRISDEPRFEIRPPERKTRPRDEARLWSKAFKKLAHLVRMSSRKSGNRGGGAAKPRPYSQRCAVRVTYSPNRGAGQWAAHGRYIARESASENEEGLGFNAESEMVPIDKTLGAWQAAGDERMFKIIVSPEFGERMDLQKHTRELMNEMAHDLDTRLQWVAVAHHNTAHPHVHVALRGVNERGEGLRLAREYVRSGIRRHAEDLCTAQLGYRTQHDAEEAQRREIDQTRYTSLDQLINRAAHLGAGENADFFQVTVDPCASGRTQDAYQVARLNVLERMGLAESIGGQKWRVRRDFKDVLRAMQRAGDHQKTLAAHGALLSDERLPLQVTPAAEANGLEGRVVGHGLDEGTDRPYVLIEGTDAKVHFMYQDEGISAARHAGKMRVNSLVRLKRVIEDGRQRTEVDDFGDAEEILQNKSYLRKRTRSQSDRLGDDPTVWGGWLGRYRAAIAQESRDLGAARTKARDRGLR